MLLGIIFALGKDNFALGYIMYISFTKAAVICNLNIRSKITFLFAINILSIGCSFSVFAGSSLINKEINKSCWIYEYEYHNYYAEKQICFNPKGIAEVFTFAARDASSYDVKWSIYDKSKLKIDGEICDFYLGKSGTLYMSNCWFEGSYLRKASVRPSGVK